MAELMSTEHLACLLAKYGARRVSFAGLWGYMETEQIRHDLDDLRREIKEIAQQIHTGHREALDEIKRLNCKGDSK